MKRGHLHWGVLEGLSEDMTFEWRPEDTNKDNSLRDCFSPAERWLNLV